LHELVNVMPAYIASPGTNELSVVPGWVKRASRQKRPPVPSMRSRNAEIRDSSRPGSQAPHAPPALTFGLPGKQRVNEVRTGCVLMCRLNALPGNVSNLVTN
jgi:hypothetical protein